MLRECLRRMGSRIITAMVRGGGLDRRCAIHVPTATSAGACPVRDCAAAAAMRMTLMSAFARLAVWNSPLLRGWLQELMTAARRMMMPNPS